MKEMKAMPYALKQKLRQYDKANGKARELHQDITDMLNEYGVPYDNLTACNTDDEPRTEALACINNNEGDVEGSIAEIEEIFLYFVNKKN